MELEKINILVDKKNNLIKELAGALKELELAKVDMLADKKVREAVESHAVNWIY